MTAADADSNAEQDARKNQFIKKYPYNSLEGYSC